MQTANTKQVRAAAKALYAKHTFNVFASKRKGDKQRTITLCYDYTARCKRTSFIAAETKRERCADVLALQKAYKADAAKLVAELARQGVQARMRVSASEMRVYCVLA